MTRKSNNKTKQGSNRKQGEPKVIGEVLVGYFISNEPLAAAWRDRKVFPNTELGIDLKLMTRQPGRMNVGEYRDGMITCDGDGHYTFIENAHERKETVRRYPHMYVGKRINVIRRNDGRLHTTFNKPHYDKGDTFQDFCREAAEELTAVAGLVEKKQMAEK